ncbi:hypothetical protein BOTNAR_0127g00220 [Botryotinia narcissicola]|uniref:Uncharacterized protein n=1 Tax=Botryotinia narcissicola TaxID=278944 RepID=A0A4Z1IJG6_9HELO|nr:hypothetical protein BOTNAR_0127g00220 [Botryotinia narcissicola]
MGTLEKSNLADKTFVGFATRSTVCVRVFRKIPALGVGIVSTGQSLYQSPGFSLSPQKALSLVTLLIYGETTTTAMLAVRFAKL